MSKEECIHFSRLNFTASDYLEERVISLSRKSIEFNKVTMMLSLSLGNLKLEHEVGLEKSLLERLMDNLLQDI